MLFRITNKCYMNCSHCLVNATPEGEHMPLDVLGAGLKYIEEVKPRTVLITGGEPTLHPYFLDICKEVLKLTKKINAVCSIISNGTFSEDEEYTKKILSLNIPIQVTNDPHYYPKRIKKINSPLIGYVDEIMKIDRVGRAKKNNMKSERICPSCFNMYSIINRNSNDMYEAIQVIESKGYFCSLVVDIDGSIRIGESGECLSVGNVLYDNAKTSHANAKKFTTDKCNNCCIMSELNPLYKAAIDLKL